MTDFSSELGHVQLEVADLDRSVAFYRKFLGLKVTERVDSRKGRLAFLSGGRRHHDVALRAAPGGGAGSSGGAGRNSSGGAGGQGPAAGVFSAPFQVAFELSDQAAFADLLFLLRSEGVPATALDHGISWALYFRDPDGNPLEAYLDLRDEEGGRRRWGGESRLLALDEILSRERLHRLLEEREGKPVARSGDTDSGRAAPGDGSGPEVAGDRSGTED